MLDTSQNLIVINGYIRTVQIENCRYEAPNKYYIVFAGNPKEYAYWVDKVLWLKNPEALDPIDYRLAHNGRRLTNIAAIFKFRDYTQTYWHIRFENGTEKSYKGSDLQVTGSCLADSATNNIFQYLQQVAAANALPGDDGRALLAKQYDKVRFVSDETALATYLNPDLFKPQTYAKRRLIYPFGSNASQLKAVQKAFEHSVSVIQGPPGTGKTQIILNIIANILVAGKTVLVVSNNNSATDNVLEKLLKYEFGFLAAPLGNSDNKQRFIESQEKEKQYPQALASWHTAEANRFEFLEQIDRQLMFLPYFMFLFQKFVIRRTTGIKEAGQLFETGIDSRFFQYSFYIRNGLQAGMVSRRSIFLADDFCHPTKRNVNFILQQCGACCGTSGCNAAFVNYAAFYSGMAQFVCH